MQRAQPPKPVQLDWVGDSKRRYNEFPREVQRAIGRSLMAAQYGVKATNAKPWKGIGPGVFEVVQGYFGDAFRAVYTVRFEKHFLCPSCVQEKVEVRHLDASDRCRIG